MSFGDVVRSASLASNYARAVGGDADTIWHGYYIPASTVAYLRELSTSDFSVVRTSSDLWPDYYLIGVGGDANTIWGCNNHDGGTVYEYDPSDLSLVRSDSAPDTNPSGIGGNASTIWLCGTNGNNNYELDVSDFSTVQNLACPDSNTDPVGIGGGSTHVWHTDSGAGALYELANNLTKVQSASWPVATGQDIGGDDTVIWHCSYEPKVYELDSGYISPADLSFVSICFIG